MLVVASISWYSILYSYEVMDDKGLHTNNSHYSSQRKTSTGSRFQKTKARADTISDTYTAKP